MSAESSKKVIVITGANSGIGLATTRILTSQGHQVIMACRSEEKAQAAIEQVKKANPQADVIFMQLDLQDVDSIRKFADNYKSKELPLHVLVNNAGIAHPINSTDRRVTKMGWEETMATNHLGHFLLTHLMVPTLKRTAHQDGESRVVVLASHYHMLSTARSTSRASIMDMEDLHLEKPKAYTGGQAYRNAKLANVIFTYDAAERLKSDGITVNAMCPGFIPETNIFHEYGGFVRGLFGIAKRFAGWFKIRTVQQGAGDVVASVVDPALKGVTGKYYKNGKETESDPESYDEEKRTKLWQWSESLLGIKFGENLQPDMLE